MLPRMSSTLGLQVPKRQSNVAKPYAFASSSWGALPHVLLLQSHCTALLHLSGGWKDAAGY